MAAVARASIVLPVPLGGDENKGSRSYELLVNIVSHSIKVS